MGSDTTLAVTPGSGTTLKVYAQTSGGSVQYIRELDATAMTHGAWTLSATASTSYIAADVQRIGVIMVNNGSLPVYIRFDSTAPTTTVNHWYLDSGDRYEVPYYMASLAMSFVSTGTGGSLTYSLATAV
jgi:hypothetical protein